MRIVRDGEWVETILCTRADVLDAQRRSNARQGPVAGTVGIGIDRELEVPSGAGLARDGGGARHHVVSATGARDRRDGRDEALERAQAEFNVGRRIGDEILVGISGAKINAGCHQTRVEDGRINGACQRHDGGGR